MLLLLLRLLLLLLLLLLPLLLHFRNMPKALEIFVVHRCPAMPNQHIILARSRWDVQLEGA